MRITVNQASIRIDADNGLQEMEAYGGAPEPSVPLRSSHANLSYLLDRYPDATWIDPGSRLLEVRAARIVAEQDRPKPGEYERKWPFKMACLPFQLDVFAAARHMKVFALAPVAMGCVDASTEYLSPTGWRRIDQYAGGPVAQYLPETEEIEFVGSPKYVKLPCTDMLRFKTTRGVDQLLSPEHRVMLADGEVVTAEFLSTYWPILSFDKVKFRTTFKVKGRPGIPLTDAQIRVQVAVNADGYMRRDEANPNYDNVVTIRIKKKRKKERLRALLEAASIDYREKPAEPEGFTSFRFKAPANKGFDNSWWDATAEQLAVVADEVAHWDGSERKAEGLSFFTRDARAAEFVQYAFSSVGRRTSCAGPDKRGDYIVHSSSRPPVAGLFASAGSRVSNITPESSPDGFKYCFMVPSTFLILRRNGCIFASGNTGKTKMVLDIAADKFMRDEIDCMCVIAPNGVNRQWVNTAIPMHMSNAAKAYADVWRPGRKEPLPSSIAQFDPDTHLGRYMRIATFNVEAFSTESGKAFLAARAFMSSGRCMLVMDESSRIKSFRAIRTKVIDKLRQYSVVRCNLSGTPITKGLEDLYSQYNLLDPSIIGMSSFWTFRGRYCHLASIPGAPANAMKIVGYRNVEEFVRKIAPVTFVIPKGVLGLPEKTYERREVEMTGDQKRLYKALKDEMISDLRANRIQTPANAAVRLLRLQQLLSGHVVTVDENVVNGEEVRILSSMPVESNRLSVLYDALQEHDGPAVIWARFTADITDIENYLIAKGHKVVTYYGETSTKDRETAVRRFRDGEVDYFIANPDAAGTGLDGLQVAQLAVYYSNSFRAESRWQSEDRIHRLGMAGSAHFIDLVVPNSTDGLVLKNLTEKGNVAKAVFDNPSLLEGTDN